MSSAAAAAVPAPKSGSKKKLLIIIVAAVLLLVVGGAGAAVFVMKSRAAAAAAADEDGDSQAEAAAPEGKKVPPVFVPLDAFTVNLADQDSERYAQVGVTLQIEDAQAAEEIKLYMPAIRNGVLMVLSHKTSKDLADRAGKEQLADEIMREAVRPMGIEIALEDPEADAQQHEAPADPDAEEAPKPKKKKKKKAPEVHNPVTGVNFSSFIIQ